MNEVRIIKIQKGRENNNDFINRKSGIFGNDTDNSLDDKT